MLCFTPQYVLHQVFDWNKQLMNVHYDWDVLMGSMTRGFVSVATQRTTHDVQ